MTTERGGRTATGTTPHRSWRPPPALYDQLKAVAAARGETVTDALIRSAHWYIDRYGPAPARDAEDRLTP